MTFYEAALDVLGREGKPLHYEEITKRAIDEGLLSHVGRVPMEIMRARLLAMARREDGKYLAIVEPGVFALAVWGANQDPAAMEETEPEPIKKEPMLRPTERTPMTLAEKRAVREAERTGRFETEDREARTRSQRRKRRPRKGETPLEALCAIINEVGGGPIDLQYVVDAIPRQSLLPKGFPRDLEGLRKLACSENATLEKSGTAHRFALEGDRVTLLPELPPKEQPQAVPVEAPITRSKESIDEATSSLLAALRQLVADKLERVFLELADRHSFVDAKVAKRSAKGSPLFTGMVRYGVTQIRVAVRMILSGRDVRLDDVDEIRGDLENYSAAIGVLLSLGKIPRNVRSRAEDMSQKPVLLFDGESIAYECVRSGLGVRSRIEEVVEVVPGLLDEIASVPSSPTVKKN